jgi:hypothetical protein
MPKNSKEWNQYDKPSPVPTIKSDYDLKAHILTTSNNVQFNKILTIVTKELDTSLIPNNDKDLKNIYQVQFENVLEWAAMGLVWLAQLRLAKLWGELKIEKSVGGFERLLQAASLSGSVVTEITPSRKSSFRFFKKPQEQQPQNILEQDLE